MLLAAALADWCDTVVMYFQRRKDGWQVTVAIGVDPLTGKRRRASATRPTKREAQQAGAELLAEHRERNPGTKVRTVGQLFDVWLEQVAPDLSPKTLHEYAGLVRRYLRPAFGDLPLRKLTPERIDDLYLVLRTTGNTKVARPRPLSQATVARAHAVLSDACIQAVRWRWLSSNPCATADKGRVLRSDIEAPAIEDVAAIEVHADRDLRDAIQLAIGTGARRGELCGLQWADIDFDAEAPEPEPTITIRRSVGDIAGEAVVIPHRRKSRIRTVAIDPQTTEVLRARRARAAELALKTGKGLEDAGYVLADQPGQRLPLRPALITQRWELAAKHAEKKVRFHDLRHWHATMLGAGGVSVPNIVDRMGWSSAQMLTRYAHAIATVDRTASDLIGERAAR